MSNSVWNNKPSSVGKAPTSQQQAQMKSQNMGKPAKLQRKSVPPYMNTLPEFILIDGNRWYRTSAPSLQFKTYSYCPNCNSTGTADSMVEVSEHLTLVPDQSDDSKINNIHWTEVTSKKNINSDHVYDLYTKDPSATCSNKFVVQCFEALFMETSALANNNNSGFGKGFG